MRDFRCSQRSNVFIPAARQRSDDVCIFKIDEVIGSLRGVQFRFGQRPPAVGLGPQIFDLVDGIRRFQKRRYVYLGDFPRQAG